MSNKLIINTNKTLKLSNVLLTQVDLEEAMEGEEINKVVIQMESYIKTKGAKPLGPLIQYTRPEFSEENQVQIQMKLLRQVTSFINHVEAPYKMEPIIRVSNCIYCRYIGPEDKLKFAYDKIFLTAFEEDIPLKGDSYTVFVDRDEEAETITADVFMEKNDNE